MEWFHWTLVIVCILALTNETPAKLVINGPFITLVNDDVRKAVDTFNEALKSSDEALNLYSKELDSLVPWMAFNETLAELDKYKADYSEETAQLIGKIKWLMEDGIDAYYRASQSISDWCNIAIPLLTTYIGLFNGYTVERAHQQKTILVAVLDRGITKMTAAQSEISSSSSSFNNAAGQLTTLNSRFQMEFNEKSKYFQSKVKEIRIGAYAGSTFFGLIGLGVCAALVELKYVPELKEKLGQIAIFYDSLTEKVQQAFRNIDDTKRKLKKEIQEIGDLKVRTEEIKTFVDLDEIPELRDTIVQSARIFMYNSNRYRRKHARQMNH